ncbi:LytR/AlgR family response regulator transcription factor [Bacteroidota bacterium]
MIRTLIIDDEKNARNAIREMLLLMFSDIEICGEADGVYSGLKLINETAPDLIFLDIKMGDGTGFDLLRRLENKQFSLVFLTAFDEHALEAFRFAATDYLLKPVDPEDLQEAIKRVRAQKEKYSETVDVLLDNLSQKQIQQRKLVLKTSRSIHLINQEEIIHCESSGNYTHFYLTEGKTLLISKPLKEYDDLLEPLGFMRVHQSHLINLNHVLEIDKRDGLTLIMSDNTRIPVSTRRKEFLLQRLDKFL